MSINGFKVGNNVEKYDYYHLDNLPDLESAIEGTYDVGRFNYESTTEETNNLFYPNIESFSSDGVKYENGEIIGPISEIGAAYPDGLVIVPSSKISGFIADGHITISFDYKTETDNEQDSIGIGIYDSSNNLLSSGSETYADTTTWSHKKRTLDVPATAHHIKFRHVLNGSTIAHVKNLQAEIGIYASEYVPNRIAVDPKARKDANDALDVLHNFATSVNLFDEEKVFSVPSAWTYSEEFYHGPLKGSGSLYAALGPNTDGIPLSFPWNGYKENTQYTVSLTGKHIGEDASGNGLMVKAVYTDDTSETIVFFYNDQRKAIRKTGVTDVAKTVKKLYFTYGTGGNNDAYIKDMIVCEGLTTGAYSKYQVVANDKTAETVAEAARTYDGFIFRLNELPQPIPVGAEHISYIDLIGMWDDLANDINALAEKEYHQPNNFADSVTKSKIGESSTTDSVITSYDIFSYTFEPRNAEMTVLLTAGCDGNEYEAYWSLYRFMKALYFEGYKYPNLRNLRHRVRFVCVPSWNPWGLDNNLRYCPLGFQTLENLNASVTVDGTTYPAFSSKECQAIRDVISNLFATYGKIDLWVDMHTDPFSAGNNWKKAFYGYAVNPSRVNDVLYGLTLDFDNMIFEETGSETNFTIYNSPTSSDSGMPGYGNGRGIPTALIEMAIGEFKTAPDSSEMMQTGSAQTMKYAQEWYWNVIANMIAGK